MFRERGTSKFRPKHIDRSQVALTAPKDLLAWDLPEPERPQMARNSPRFFTVKETSAIAFTVSDQSGIVSKDFRSPLPA